MNSKTISLRPRPNVVTLFDSIFNKMLEWRERWLCVKCTIGFSFPPLANSLEAWRPVGKKPNYFEFDNKFFEFIRNDLGDDTKTQTKVFSSSALLEAESLRWCGMGGLKVEDRRQLLGLADNDEYLAWRLHLNRVFFDESPAYTSLNSAGCRTGKGRN